MKGTWGRQVPSFLSFPTSALHYPLLPSVSPLPKYIRSLPSRAPNSKRKNQAAPLKDFLKDKVERGVGEERELPEHEV